MFAALDWLPTLVNIAGGREGRRLKKRIEAGNYPGIVKTTLDGVDQRDYLEGKTEKSAREVFFYYTGATPSAVRYKNWKFYFTMVPDTAMGGLTGCQHLPLDSAPEHPARSVRDDRRRRRQVDNGLWG